MKTKNEASELIYIIDLPPSVRQFVGHLKKHIREVLGHSFDSQQVSPHISLFRQTDPHAERFLYDADHVLKSFKPFHINLKNLNVFKHGDKRTIYLEVVNKWPLCDVFEQLTGEQDFFPHVVIAKDLEAEDFFRVWHSLKDYPYINYFRCDRVTVLKKETKKWVPYVELPFAA